MKSRLSEIFLHLDLEELRQLSKYLRSPFFNHQEKTVELFDYLRKRRQRGWKPEHVHRKLFPGEAFDAQRLHHLNSALLGHIEDFLAWRDWRGRPGLPVYHLLSAYRKKKLAKHFGQTKRRLEKELEGQALRNEDYLNMRHQLLREDFIHLSGQVRHRDFELQELSHAQDLRFMAEKLKEACTMISHQNVSRQHYDYGLLDAVLEKVGKQEKWLSYPAISLYYHSFQALSDNDGAAHFQALKQELEEYGHCFPLSERRNLHILAINYAIRRINSGSGDFMSEVFLLYRKGLAAGVFVEHGILSRWTYNNAIMAALSLREFAWAERFIHDYKESLEEKTREDTFRFNLAKLHFERRDYQKTMRLLLQTHFDDFLHSLRAKVMLLKIYYELEEWDALDSLLESFKTYVRRKKEMGYHRENYLNIIQLTKKLLHTNPFDKQDLEGLRKEIELVQPLTERAWLLEMLDGKSA